MSEYRPTTENLRHVAESFNLRCKPGVFDAWLAAHDAEIRADERAQTLEAIVAILNEKYPGIPPFLVTKAEFAAARGEGTR